MTSTHRLLTALAKGWLLPWVLVGIGTAVLAQGLAPVLFDPPQLRSAFPSPAPTSVLFGTVAALSATSTLHEPSVQVLAMSGRRRRSLRVLRVVLAIALGCVGLGLASPEQAASSCTVVLTVAGESLVLARLVTLRYSWLLPALHMCAAVTLGAQASGTTAWWAWPVQPDPGPTGVGLAAAVVLVGVIVSVRPGATILT